MIQKQILQRCKPLLGTFVAISVCDTHKSDDALVAITEKAFKIVEALEKHLSFHDENSQLSYINQHAHDTPCQLSSHLLNILDVALLLSQRTAGLFDVCSAHTLVKYNKLPDIRNHTLKYSGNWQDIIINRNENTIAFKQPLLIDLGGIAKGYIVDQAFEAIADEVEQVVINAGGDLRIKDWCNETANIKQINAKGEMVLNTTTMQASALASSAVYPHALDENRFVDMRSNKLFNQTNAASIFAPNCLFADALTKIVILEVDNKDDILFEMNALEYSAKAKQPLFSFKKVA